MSNLETHTTSLELSLALKEAGSPQEGSLFYWFKWRKSGGYQLMEDARDVSRTAYGENDEADKVAASPLASELMARMPYKGDYWFKVTRRPSGLWLVELLSKRGGWVCSFLEMELSNALTELVLYLVKDGKMKF